MSRRMRASGWVALIAVLCFAPLAFGGDTVNITLQDGGPYTMDGIYVGPYDATINNQPAQIICDDFQHEVSPGESWTANVTSVSSLTNSTTGLVWSGALAGGALLGGTTYSLVQGYDAMAYLASEMLGNKNGTQVGYLAYAIWAVFDASAVQSWLNAHGDSAAWSIVQGLAEGALKGTYTASEFAGWEILTPICSGNSCPNGPPQEFLEFVPEGGSTLMYLLLVGVSCFGTMLFRSRRRRAASEAV